MDNNKEIKIIAFVGLPGAGISTATEYVTSKGYPKVYYGGIIYDEMDKAGIEHTPENEATFRIEIRKQLGADFATKRIDQEIRNLIASGQHRIVVDGLYSWDEYKTMKHDFPGELIAIAVVTPKHMRHRRLASRPKRPLTATEADQRDWAEIEDIGKGGPIAIADHYIMNDSDFNNLYGQIDKTLNEIGFYN